MALRILYRILRCFSWAKAARIPEVVQLLIVFPATNVDTGIAIGRAIQMCQWKCFKKIVGGLNIPPECFQLAGVNIIVKEFEGVE